MKLRYRLSITLAAVVAASCATTGNGAAAETSIVKAADFYPLEIGNTWKYEVDAFTQKSAETVTLLRVVDGFVEDSKGQHLKADGFGVRDQDRYLLRDPVVPGTKWTNVVSVSSVEHSEIIGVDQPCESPAGQWPNCVVVQSRVAVPSPQDNEKATLEAELTFAPHVGLVHVATTLERASGQRLPQVSLRLLSFAPAQPQRPTSSPPKP